MKKLTFLMAALLVAMTGCQKEPQVSDETQDANARHYVAVNINLPNTMGTKANDNYENGETAEFAVKDVTLVFYKDGEYVETHANVKNSWGDKSAESNATVTIKGKTEAVKVNSADINQVLVLINSTGITPTNYENKKFSEFQASVYESIDLSSTENGFFMCNAPVYKNDEFVTLADISVFDNELAALNTPATVSVERAVAKVQVDYGTTTFSVDSYYPDGDTKSTVKFTEWGLSTVNKKTYAVRKYEDKNGTSWWNEEEFVHSSLRGTDRLYFSVDPNYSEYVSEDFSNSEITNSNNDYVYCYENTFDIDNMKQDRTTAVILKGKFTPAGMDTGDTWYMVGPAKEPMTEENMLKAINAALDSDVEYDALIWNADKSLDWTQDSYKEAQGAVVDVIKYEEGVCYYPVLIRHFTAEENGYSSESEFKTSYETDGAYDTKDLGRYGVVRNNWYKLTVSSVSEPGSPVEPTPDGTNDDEITRYCACTIDILAWNIRTQDVVL